MSDELTSIYQRIGHVEDKLDEVLELLKRLDPGARGWAKIANDLEDANWTCDSCRSPNSGKRTKCGGCGATRPGPG